MRARSSGRSLPLSFVSNPPTSATPSCGSTTVISSTSTNARRHSGQTSATISPPLSSSTHLRQALTAGKPRLQLTNSFFTYYRLEAQEHNTLYDVVEFSKSERKLTPPNESGGAVSGQGQQPPDERTLKLGKMRLTGLALQILQSRLPSVLASPLPQEILSPQISLHLFPSTHPHLPTVSGRVAYHAALWTSPITWGRVPLIGNVRLKIVSERMVKNGPLYRQRPARDKAEGEKPHGSTARSTPIPETLIVRWKTCAKQEGANNGSGASVQVLGRMTEWLRRESSSGADGSDGFEGLFIFEFDEHGRILSHTIERAEHTGMWDEGVGKWVGLTDWLLGRVTGSGIGSGGSGRGGDIQPHPGLALGYIREASSRTRSRFGNY